MRDRGFSRDLEREIDECEVKESKACPKCYGKGWVAREHYWECGNCGYLKFRGINRGR